MSGSCASKRCPAKQKRLLYVAHHIDVAALLAIHAFTGVLGRSALNGAARNDNGAVNGEGRNVALVCCGLLGGAQNERPGRLIAHRCYR